MTTAQANDDTVDEAIAGGTAARSPSRESVYMSKATEKLYAGRERRLAFLKDPTTRTAITRATDRLTSIAHPERDYVVIRSEFIYRLPARAARDSDRPEDITTRPPLTRVVKGKNQHAIALYLTNLFVEQMLDAHVAADSPDPPPEPRRRHSVYNIDSAPSWASLIGLPSVNRRNQRKSYNRALDALQKWELVDLGAAGQRYANFTLNREDGSGRPYTIPRGEPAVPQHLCLPAGFFTTGWHLILTPSELATLMAVCHVADRNSRRRTADELPGSIFLAESLRYRHLGLTDEAYLAIHQLAEFGLIAIDDPMPGRRRGRIPPSLTGEKRPQPYQLTATILGGFPSAERAFDPDVFKRPAIDVASDSLSSPLPRYAQWAGTSRRRP